MFTPAEIIDWFKHNDSYYYNPEPGAFSPSLQVDVFIKVMSLMKDRDYFIIGTDDDMFLLCQPEELRDDICVADLKYLTERNVQYDSIWNRLILKSG